MSNVSTTAEVRNTGLAFGGVVAAVAATASYSHMRELAYHHAAKGTEWLSWLVPLSVDALMVVASIVAVLARRRGSKIPPLALVALVATLTISLVANFAAPAADLIGQVINMWPAAAFAFAYELVLELFQLDVKPRAKRAPKIAPAAVVPSPAASGVPSSDVPAPRAAVEPDAAPAAGASLRVLAGAGESFPVAGAPAWLTDDLRTRPRDAMWRYLDEHGDTTGAELDRFGAQYLGTKPTLGRKVRADWRKAQEQEAIAQ
jgi:hypothetical protein